MNFRAIQGEFHFEMTPPGGRQTSNSRDGVAAWHKEIDQAMHEAALKMGLPVGHLVEVCLKDGVILRGTLRIGEVVLSLEKFDRNKLALRVGEVIFFYAEIEACLRLD